MLVFVALSAGLAIGAASEVGTLDTSVELSPAQATAAPAANTAKGTFAFGNEYWHSDSKIGSGGFLSGLRGFEHFYTPMGNPIYFETPFNNTSLRGLFLNHGFATESQLGGGYVNVAALQIRLAITERLGFIATKDGYSWLRANGLPEESGWNDLAAGLKYVFYVDREADLVMTGGLKYNFGSGTDEVLQGSTCEIIPFLSIAKGWDRFHTIGGLTYRLPTDGDDGNDVFQWDLHADYEIAPKTLPGFAPMLEVHGLHYLSDGTKLPLSVGGLDYANIGSSDVSGSTVIWGTLGARWKLSPHLSLGGAYEYPFTNKNADIMGDRISFDIELTY
jgi:hypothetical protein